MSIRGGLLAGLMLLGACAVGERPILMEEGTGDLGGAVGDLTEDGVTIDGPTEGTTGASVDLDAEPSAGIEPDPVDPTDPADGTDAGLTAGPGAVISPTGVLLLVNGVDDQGAYLVQTPCGEEYRLRWGQPVDPVQIVIDPGHGGDEEGAIGPGGGTEAELNLDVSRRTAALLKTQGYEVILTRSADYRLPIRYRAALADRLSASVLVSVHHNSPTPAIRTEEGPGTEVYVQVGNAESIRLGGLLHREIVAALSAFDVEWAGASNAGVLSVINTEGDDAYGINRYPETVAALAELAYLSNPTEAVLLRTDDYRQTAAEALTSAIIAYLQNETGGTEPQPEPRLFTPAGGTGGLEGCIDPALD